jgi:hypothetical protein
LFVLFLQKVLPLMRFSTLFLLLMGAVASLPAAEFSAQIVDGLGRAIPGVQVEVACVSPRQETRGFDLESDAKGKIHSTYDARSCKPLFVSLEKQGYESYRSGVRARYVLRRQFRAQELFRVIALVGDNQQHELRELLAGDFSQQLRQFQDSVFYYEARLRPALRDFLRDAEVTVQARELLSIIGVSEDLHLIVQLATPPVSQAFPERWRYAVATMLVNPDGDDEWAFLRKCALNEFDDRWVDAGAIQALKLNGSPRSRTILDEAQQKNPAQAARIKQALAYIESNPKPLADADLVILAERVAQVIKIGTWEGNSEPRFNEAGDKALVDFTFQAALDRLVYTATFHRTDGRWKLRGVNETYQEFAPAPIKTPPGGKQ